MVLLPSLCFLVFCLLAPDSYAKMGSGPEGILGNEDAGDNYISLASFAWQHLAIQKQLLP